MKEATGNKPINNDYGFLEKHPIIPNLSIYNAISLLSRFYRNVEAIDCLDLTVSYDEMLKDAITMSKALKELGIKKGDIITFEYNKESEIKWDIYPSNLDIRYEDNDYLVIFMFN